MDFNYSVVGTNLHFKTGEKLFSTTGPDLGTLAMLSKTKIEEEDKVLDLGCGYGFVGITLKVEYPLIEVHMVDNDPLAVEYAKKNNTLNNLNIKTWLSDGFSNVEDEDYTKILSNPPYHADFSVPKKFIEDGFNHLVLGGQLIMVVKRLLWYKNKMTTVFGGVTITPVDDYFVLISEKRTMNPPKKKSKPLKKKHLKRLKDTKRRKKRNFNKEKR